MSDNLRDCPLFAGISRSHTKKLLGCLSAVRKRFEKNSFIFAAGEPAEHVGIALAGAVHILREDFWGKRKILTRIEPGGLFGEAFACAGVKSLPVSAAAAEDCEVMLLNSGRLISPCASACAFHTVLINNLMLIMAEKNIALTRKLEHVTQPTTREKLLSYLSEQARIKGSAAFEIPFGREELADYLSVERSAMSAELSRMRGDGLINYKKGHFELLKHTAAR